MTCRPGGRCSAPQARNLKNIAAAAQRQAEQEGMEYNDDDFSIEDQPQSPPSRVAGPAHFSDKQVVPFDNSTGALQI